MRLLLDEMYPPAIAGQLQAAGYDAVSVHEVADACGAGDPAVCDLAVASGRAIVTENAADFLPLVRSRIATGAPAPALIVTSNRSFPRHRPLVTGQMVRALGAFCDQQQDADPLSGAVYWLRLTRLVPAARAVPPLGSVGGTELFPAFTTASLGFSATVGAYVRGLTKGAPPCGVSRCCCR